MCECADRDVVDSRGRDLGRSPEDAPAACFKLDGVGARAAPHEFTIAHLRDIYAAALDAPPERVGPAQKGRQAKSAPPWP